MRRVLTSLARRNSLQSAAWKVHGSQRCFASSPAASGESTNQETSKDPRIQARPPGESADEFESKFPLPNKEKEMELSRFQVHVGDLYKQGNYQKALKEAKYLLKETRDHFGDDHPATAAAHNNVGLLHKQLGQFDDARFSYKTAMKLYKKTVGADHHSYASALHNLGTLNRSQTHLDATLKATDRLTLMDESAAVLEQAYIIRSEELGDQHPHTVASRSSWGATLAAQILHSYKQVKSGQYVNVNTSSSKVPDLAWDVSEEHLRQALATAINNPRGPSIAKKKPARGKHSKSKAAAAAADSAADGIQTLSAASAAQNLAVFLKARASTETEESIKDARLEEAHKLYTDCLTVRTQLLPNDHPDVYATKYSMAELLQARGDEKAANAIRQEILDTYDPPADEDSATVSAATDDFETAQVVRTESPKAP